MSAEVPARKGSRSAFTGMALAAFAAVLLLPAAGRAFDPLWSDPGNFQRGPSSLPGDAGPVQEGPVTAPTGELSLSEAVNLALLNNAQLKESWAKVKLQAAALGTARTAYLPTLMASGGKVDDGISYVHSASAPPPSWTQAYQASATANWQVFNFGAGFFGDRSAGYLLESALSDHNAALQQALATVIQAYFDAFTAREVYFGDKLDAEIAVKTLASAKRREARGGGTRSDTLQATTEMLKRVLDRNQSEGDYHEALGVLNYDMGLPQDTDITFPETLKDDFPYSGEDLKAWLVEAQVSHPAIISAEKQVAAAKDAVLAAAAAGLPSVDLSANYYLDGRPGLQLSGVDSKEILLSATVNVPVFDGLVTLYKVRSAKASLEQQEAALEDVRGSVLRDVVKAYWDTDTAYRNLGASEDLLKAARQGMDVAQRRFDKGAADLIEVFTAEIELADARHQRIRSLAQWRSARLRLVASVGLLGRSTIDAQ